MKMKLTASTISSVLFLFLLVPYTSYANIVVIGDLSYEDVAEIGGTYQGVILLQNDGKKPQKVKVYQNDYLHFYDGRCVYKEPAGEEPRSNATWITVSPEWFTIPPGELMEVVYRVKVPDDSLLVGSYWSLIMVEGVVTPKNIPGTIIATARYAIQVVTSIGNTGTRQLRFLDIRVLEKAEGKVLQVDVENIGERFLRPSLLVELYGEDGICVGKFEGKKLRIHPETSVRFKVDLGIVAEGKYKTLIVADNGAGDVFGATYTLSF